MTPLGGFETAPRLAVAVSGGADSLALALLARDWAASRAGAVCALIVDHALRPEAAAEAARTAELLHKQAIAAKILREFRLCGTVLPSRPVRARRGIRCSFARAPKRASFICCSGTMRRTRPKPS